MECQDIAREIHLGANICARLKLLKYASEPWVDCYHAIASEFSGLKREYRAKHPTIEIFDILGMIWHDLQGLKE